MEEETKQELVGEFFNVMDIYSSPRQIYQLPYFPDSLGFFTKVAPNG
jgi:hypothetical protein